jgi:nucleotidyltransferase substrate binding protein (TIGR01987 family)
MEEINFTYANIQNALDRLEEALIDLERIRKKMDCFSCFDPSELDRLERSLRDSTIQRFEFCTDLFWKYLKKYLEETLGNPPTIISPTPVIRLACKAELINPTDTETFIRMIKDRNFSSHMYREEIADRISVHIPTYYKLMRHYITQLNT